MKSNITKEIVSNFKFKKPVYFTDLENGTLVTIISHNPLYITTSEHQTYPCHIFIKRFKKTEY